MTAFGLFDGLGMLKWRRSSIRLPLPPLYLLGLVIVSQEA